jgi:hypothetical protein
MLFEISVKKYKNEIELIWNLNEWIQILINYKDILVLY